MENNLKQPMNFFGAQSDLNQDYPYFQIGQCNLLGQKAVPQFGIYGYEYQWAFPIAQFKIQPKTYSHLQNIKNQLPLNLQLVIEEYQEKNQNQIQFYVLNFNTHSFKNSFLVDKNMPFVRLNFVPHPYLFPHAKYGNEYKAQVLTCIYTSDNGQFIHSSLRGVDESTDQGRISVNNGTFFSKINLQEIHLHPQDDQDTAVSPNNGAFLLNLSLPIVHFNVVLCTMSNQQVLSIFNVTFINDYNMVMTRDIESALNLQKLFIHTPVRSQLSKQKLQERVPALYTKMLSKHSKKMMHRIEMGFSKKLEQFHKVEDKEQLLKQIFFEIFVEKNYNSQFVDGFETTICDSILKLFYKFIWFKFKSPNIDNIGQKFFLYSNLPIDFQIKLIYSFMILLQNQLQELNFEHNLLLKHYISKDDTQIIDEEVLDDNNQNEEEKSSLLDQLQEEDKKQNIEIKVNNQKIEDIIEESNFIQNMQKDVQFPELHLINEHLEALFMEDQTQTKKSFNQLTKLVQDLIFHETWKYKGSISGIHFDFGRHSYFQTEELGAFYHMNNEERINLILNMQDLFTNL